MKDTFYFQHDYEPTSDPKVGALLAKYGGLGYGIWWRLIEMLHSTETHKIEKKKYIYATIAQQMLTSVEQVSDIIEYCISDCELFISDESSFWSERVFRNIHMRAASREQKSAAGKASAEKRALLKSTVVEQPSTGVQQNSTKERIEKKRKEENTNTPIKVAPKGAAKLSLVDRKTQLKNDIKPYVNTYGPSMCNEFYKYWTEPDLKKPDLMRYDGEKYFDVGRRLSTWAKRDKGTGKGNSDDTFNNAPNLVN